MSESFVFLANFDPVDEMGFKSFFFSVHNRLEYNPL